MIEVELPNGTIAEFPDTMQPQEIEAVLQRQFGSASQQQDDLSAGVLGLPAVAAEGATFGFAPKIAAGIGSLFAKPVLEARELITGQEAPALGELYRMGAERYQGLGRSAREEMPILSALAEIGGAVGTGIGAAGTAPIRALGSLAGRGGLAGRAATGAAVGEASQRLYEAGTADVGQEAEILGREGVSLGGVLGGAIPVAGAAGRGAVGAITPAIKDTAKETMKLASKYGVPLGLDDLADSAFYKHLIQKGSKLPFAGQTSAAGDQLKAFTKAVAKTVGLDDADDLRPSNIDKAFEMVGKEFDDLGNGKTFGGEQITSLIADIQEEALDTGATADARNALARNAEKVLENIGEDGLIKGEQLNTVRSQINAAMRKAKSIDAKELLSDLENGIIEVMTEDVPSFAKTKLKYKNLLAVEPLALKVQEEGILSPALLNNQVKRVFGTRALSRGNAGDLGELALLGQVIKQQVPDSGTAIGNVILGAATGGNVPLAFYSPTAALGQLGATGLGLAANRGIQSRNINQALIQRLANEAAGSAPAVPQYLAPQLTAGSALGALQQ